MRLTIKKLDLVWDGFLPRDSMAGDRYREVFCLAKPLIDYAFKVDRPGYIRVWWFDRYIPNVVSLRGWPKAGRFYPLDLLKAETDLQIGYYLMELGWQVKLAVHSIERQEYVTLAVFSGRGAILEENEDYKLLTLEEEGFWPAADSQLVYAGKSGESGYRSP